MLEFLERVQLVVCAAGAVFLPRIINWRSESGVEQVLGYCLVCQPSLLTPNPHAGNQFLHHRLVDCMHQIASCLAFQLANLEGFG